jgi:HD superfamily phosphohydrolase
MNCGCEYTAFPRFRGLPAYSRYTHSLGVAQIVWHFTGDEAQAAAGLLHDIATPVFAHVVDFLRGDALHQEATESGTRERIAASPELMAALSEHGVSLDNVADYHRYPLADNPAPRLSADRLEYTLGNSLRYGILDAARLQALYADLCPGQDEDGRGELVFQSRAAALCFAEAALACSKIYVSDEDRYAMQILSELLGDAIRRGVLAEAELDTTEPQVIARLEADADCAAAWRAFRHLTAMRRAEAPEGPGAWRQILAKKRFIDPMVAGEGRVSTLFPAFGERLRAFQNQSQEVWLCGEEKA